MEKININPEYLISQYSEDNLKQISSKIIHAYHKSDRIQLHYYAEKLDLNPKDFGQSLRGLFKKMILFYHPDRCAVLHKSILHHHKKGNRKALEKFYRYIHIKPEKKHIDPSRLKPDDFYEDKNHKPYTSQYKEEDFVSFMEDDIIREFKMEEYEFIEAVKSLMYGNITNEFLPEDLNYLGGELNLSNEGIGDLTGVEYCINITSLDLSSNIISNVLDLIRLSNITMLDLSNNDINNIDPIASMTSLQYLDLSFNPLYDIDLLINLYELKYLNLVGTGMENSPVLKQIREYCIIII